MQAIANKLVIGGQTVRRSTGDRRRKPAGRLSDKVSSELGFSQIRCEVIGLFFVAREDIVDKPIREVFRCK